jgi:hypothetical protein
MLLVRIPGPLRMNSRLKVGVVVPNVIGLRWRDHSPSLAS